MKRFARAATAACFALLPLAAVAGGPHFDPFAERFAVGAWNDPADLALEDGWPAGLHTPAAADTAWFAAADRILAAPEHTRLGTLVAALGDGNRAAAWYAAARSDLAEPRAAGPVTGTTGPTLAYFAALAAGDTSAAAGRAAALARETAQTQAERIVWSLRSASLSPAGAMLWPAADSLLADCGPWDGRNTWSLAVGLRRARGMSPIPPAAGEDHGRLVGRLARNHLQAADISVAPYAAELKAALGAVSLRGEQLASHLDAAPSPPSDPEYQGWWVRGQRVRVQGDAAAYERLAGRADLLPRWRLDLWRRASERRVLAGQWEEGAEALAAAFDVARRLGVPGGPRQRLQIWGEQIVAGSMARARTDLAARLLELVDSHALPAQRERLAVWRERLAHGPDTVLPAGTDRVDASRHRFLRGGASAVLPASEEARAALRAAATVPPWETWRKWGRGLCTVRGIPPERIPAARTYARDLAAADTPDACLAAALARLGRHAGVPEAIWTAALAADARRLTGGASPPRPSPVPELAERLRGSQADRHALLGVALWLGDMHGVLKVAVGLPGTGLTRDEKRRFLYPVPAPGAVLEALLAAENEPALLLAIARNESAFEPAVRSRAGALGFMQVMPFHHDRLGAIPGPGHWSQPVRAIARGDALVTENRRRYGGDPYRLLAAYNAGPEATARWDRQLGGEAGRAEFAAWIGYTETRAYVEKVLIDRDVYAWILSDPERTRPRPETDR